MMGGVDHLGTRIRAAREAAGLTRSQLAERIGVSARSIAGWENEGVFPRSKAGALEAALGIQLRDATARLEVDPQRTKLPPPDAAGSIGAGQGPASVRDAGCGPPVDAHPVTRV